MSRRFKSKSMLILIFMSSCVTKKNGYIDSFTRFPSGFMALQAVNVTFDNRAELVIANVVFSKNSLEVTFLHPLFLTPIFYMSFKNGELVSKSFVDLPKMPFEMSQILFVMKEIFEFSPYRSVIKNEGLVVNATTADGFGARFLNFTEFSAGCIYPQIIQLNKKLNFELKIEIKTTELVCK